MIQFLSLILLLYIRSSETCRTNADNQINVEVSKPDDFTFSGGPQAPYSGNSVNDMRSGAVDDIGVAVINDCITSNDLIDSIVFKYRYVYGSPAGSYNVYPTMQLQLVSQSDPNNNQIIYQSGDLDTYAYDTCGGEIACYSPLIQDTSNDLNIDISDDNYEFKLVITNNGHNVHLDLDSFALVVTFKVCVTSDICVVQNRVDIYEERLIAVETKLNNVIAQLQAVGAHSVGAGNFIDDHVKDNRFGFRNTDILLFMIDLLIILFILSITFFIFWRNGIFSKDNDETTKYSKVVNVDSDSENQS